MSKCLVLQFRGFLVQNFLFSTQARELSNYLDLAAWREQIWDEQNFFFQNSLKKQQQRLSISQQACEIIRCWSNNFFLQKSLVNTYFYTAHIVEWSINLSFPWERERRISWESNISLGLAHRAVYNFFFYRRYFMFRGSRRSIYLSFFHFIWPDDTCNWLATLAKTASIKKCFGLFFMKCVW